MNLMQGIAGLLKYIMMKRRNCIWSSGLPQSLEDFPKLMKVEITDWITATTWQVVIQRLAEIGISDLQEHIKFEVCTTPPDWQNQFNLVRGSCHGLNHHLTQMGYMRPHNRHSRYNNLYFVGASTHPGTGLPTVLVSADLTTERILQDSKKSQHVPTKLKSATSSKSTSLPWNLTLRKPILRMPLSV